MDVRLPDGTIIRGVPEGISRADLTAKLAANGYDVAKLQTPDQPQAAPVVSSVTGSAGENFLAGMGRAFVRGGRAVKQALDVPAQALERTFGGQSASRAFGMPTASESAAATAGAIAEADQLDKTLMETTGGKIGDFAGNVAMFVPTAFVPGANTVTGAALLGGGVSALTTPGDLADRGSAAMFGAAGGAAGQAVGKAAGAFASNRIGTKTADAAARQQQNAVRDATLARSQSAGYVVPPTTVNPTITNRLLESLSGKAQTQQAASVRNQEVTNMLARKALGLKEDAPLTVKTLKDIRDDAGKVYAKIADSGRVQVDDGFKRDLLALSQEADRINIDFPDMQVAAKDAIVKLTDSLSVDSFDSKSAIAAIKSLRSSGSKNMSGLVSASNPDAAALGRAQIAAADALEGQLMRHLQGTGRDDLAKAFDGARRTIAKTYSVQNALNPETGNVVAANLAKQSAKGKPLSGGLDTAASFARAFPKASAEIRDSAGVSALDAFGGMGLGVLTGNPMMVAAPAVARIGARSALLSNAGQKLARPKYQDNMLTLRLLQKSPQAGMPIGSVYADQE